MDALRCPPGDSAVTHLSGGERRRVALCRLLLQSPDLLLLDEPTTGLDVSVQALVLDTLKHLQREQHMTIILVSHDLGVIRTLADRVMVMRYGRVVEQGLTDRRLEIEEIFAPVD
jgi:putative phosphonate transport system ATP-binding protein